MRFNSYMRLFFTVLFCLAAQAQAQLTTNEQPKKIGVFVSILPQQFLVETVGGERVDVNVMVKPGQSPETFEPSPKLMSQYSNSEVYFTIGMPFEQVWIKRVTSLNKAIAVIETQDVLLSEAIKEHHHHGEHSHEFDPHHWLSPILFLEQAKLILTELSRLSPKDKQLFQNNYQRLETKIMQLHNHNKLLFEKNPNIHFITFHPAFSYFARQYGLMQIAIEVDGKEPSAKQMAKIIDRIKTKKVSYILIEKQFNQTIPQTIAQSVNAQLLFVDPLALDYLSNMRELANKINKALF